MAELRNLCEGKDIIGIIETHKDEGVMPDIQGFRKIEEKGKKIGRGRRSGGISIYIRNEIDFKIAVKDAYQILGIVKFKNRSWNIMFVYNRFGDSKLEEFNETLAEVKGKTLVLGDSKIGQLADAPDEIIDVLAERKSCSNVVENDEAFIDFINQNDLVVLNGRVSPKASEGFTWERGTQKSTIDYGLVSTDNILEVQEMEIKKMENSFHHSIMVKLGFKEELTKRKLDSTKLDLGIAEKLTVIKDEPGKVLLDILQEVTTAAVVKTKKWNFKTTMGNIKRISNKKMIEVDRIMASKLIEEPNLVWKLKNKQQVTPKATLEELHNYFKTMFTDDKKPSAFTINGTSTVKVQQITTKRCSNMDFQVPTKLIKLDALLQWKTWNDSILLSAPVLKPQVTEEKSKMLNSEVSNNEVIDALHDCKQTGAGGLDGLKFEDIARNIEVMAPVISRIYTEILEGKPYPDEWKTSLLIPVHKKGDPAIVENFRPISLQPVLAKLFSKILDRRLRMWLEKFAPLKEWQFGFKKGTSAMDAVTTMTSVLAYWLEKGRKAYTAFIDFKGAFDRVDRQLLFKKLSNRGIPMAFITVLRDMYTDTKAAVSIGSNISEPFRITNGVKQGDPLSPLLFCLFIDDLEDNITMKDVPGLPLATTGVRCLAFADDLVLIASKPFELEGYLYKLANYERNNKLTVSVEKSKVVVFDYRKGTLDKEECFQFNGKKLEVVSKFKYLGVWLSSNLNFKVAQEQSRIKLARICGTLPKLFHKFNELPIPALRTLYRGVGLTSYSYGAEIWGGLKMKRIPEYHNIVLKRAFQLPMNTSHRLLSREIEMPTADEEVKMAALRNYFRMREAHGKTLLSMAYYNFCLMSSSKNNLVKNAEKLLDDMGIPGFKSRQVNGIVAKSIIRTLLRADVKKKNRENRGSRAISINPMANCNNIAERYMVKLEYSEEARILLMIRTDCTFGTRPFVSNTCPKCNTQLENSSWHWLRHLATECIEIPKENQVHPEEINRLLYNFPELEAGSRVLLRLNMVIGMVK